MKQLDIMGNEIDYFELNKPQINIHESLKDKFRKINGYLKGKTCKECKYHKAFNYNHKTYHKCEKMGISSSEATDIRLKDCACRLFEDRSVNQWNI